MDLPTREPSLWDPGAMSLGLCKMRGGAGAAAAEMLPKSSARLCASPCPYAIDGRLRVLAAATGIVVRGCSFLEDLESIQGLQSRVLT